MKVLLWALFILVLILIISMGVGSVSLSPLQVIEGLFPEKNVIIREIRLPRVIMAALVGSVLAVSGAALQGIFRNPLADPYLLGVASGSALGGALVVWLGWSALLAPVVGLLGGLGATTITLLLAQQGRHFPVTRLILAGVVVSSVCGAATTTIMLLTEDKTREILAYTLGNLSLSGWREIKQALPYMLSGTAFLMLISTAIDALQLGDQAAQTSGVAIARLRLFVIVASSIATAGAVAYVGVIGFVGLIVPHVARLLVGGSYRLILPLSALLGATLLVAADTIARVTPIGQVGIVTTLLGGPFFLYLLRRSL